MRTDSPADKQTEPIAIVGIGCRFPGGADRPESFWDLLRNGRDAMVDVPAERWDWRKFYDADPDKPGKMYIRQAGFLHESLDQFDAQFFGISPREASRLDPQQRLLLEVTWEAIEDAGLTMEALKGSDTGVFVGGFTMDNTLTQMGVLNRHCIDSHTSTSGSMTLLSNRISHAFDFRGPSVSMDTACSASLVALHYACRSLQNGECSLAVTGGANVISRPEFSIVMSKGKFLARDGRCKTFDEKADGYGRGEGAGVVVLKRLEEALADGDPIWALVRGTGVNQDGHTPGIFMPNRESQEALLREVYSSAGILPEQVQYVEAHGTGTPAGDTAEATAIGTVVSTGRSIESPCVVGSVKTNIGHLEAAAGIAGVIKTVLCLKHGQITPHLHFQNPNPDIPFEDLNLHVPRELEQWPETEGPRLAGVNSFGYGGTNAHAVLEAFAPTSGLDPGNGVVAANSEDSQDHSFVLPLSARDGDALADVARSYAEFLEHSSAPLADIVHSLWSRRTHHSHRLAAVARSRADVVNSLRDFASDGAGEGIVVGRAGADVDSRLVFLFTGMGPQWWAMGRELMASERVFSEAVDRCNHIFSEVAGWSLLEAWEADEDTSRMHQPEIAQPANFMLQVGLVELLKSWGLPPAAVVGHSVGEVTAAYASDMLSLEDSILVSYHRSRLQQTANGKGRMLATGLSKENAAELVSDLDGLVSIASINSSSSVVLAGDTVALEEIAEFLDGQDIFQGFLQMDVAYHSYQMDPLELELRDSLQGVNPGRPDVPVYSTVTGGQVSDSAFDADYWWKNVRQPVNMAGALDSLLSDGYTSFVEIGPHPVLSSYLKEAFFQHQVDGMNAATLHRKKHELQSLMESIGTLHCQGFSVDWTPFVPAGGKYTKLPAYPWQRESYYVESEVSREDRLGGQDHPMLGRRLRSVGNVWETEINAPFFPYLKDHRIEGATVFPGAGYVEIGLALDRVLMGERNTVLEEISFQRALILDDHENHVVEILYDEKDNSFTISGTSDGERASWVRHASGRIVQGAVGQAPDPIDVASVREKCKQSMAVDEQYRELANRGHEYGTEFQRARKIWKCNDEALAEIDCTELQGGYRLHPTILDTAFQVLIASLDKRKMLDVYLPVAIERVQFYGTPDATVLTHARLTEHSPDVIKGDIVLFDETGRVYALLKGLTYQALPSTRVTRTERIEQSLYTFQWEAADLAAFIGETTDKLGTLEDGSPGAWLIVGSDDGMWDVVSGALWVGGAVGIRLSHGDGMREVAPNHYHFREGHAEDLDALRDMIGVENLRGCVYLGGVDFQSNAFDYSETIDRCTELTNLVKSFAVESTSLRLAVVTRFAQSVNNEPNSGFASTGLWGLGRVIMSEHPELHCCLLDLDEQFPNEDEWVAVLIGDHTEEEIAFREGLPYVHRFSRLRLDQPPMEPSPSGNGVHSAPALVSEMARASSSANGTASTNGHSTPAAIPAVELEIGQVGVLDSLRYREVRRQAPGAGEVEVKITAVALNFKDVMKVMGLLSENVLAGTYFGDTLGMECSGTIASVGAGVAQFSVGDEVVVAAGLGCFRSYLTLPVDETFIVPRPSRMTMAEAPIIVPYLTAYYGLNTVAGLRRDERVLIHSASGGVGLAAVRYAQTVGAEIFATAGTSEKREYLTSIGVPHVMDSRTLDFADQVMEVTDGRGVDVVLNSLFGEALVKSFEIVAPYGRFIEIGKRDIDGNQGLPMRAFNKNLTFASVDLDRIVIEKRDFAAELLQSVYEKWESGQFAPLPTTVYRADQVADAFRFMGQAKHIGKVVVTMDQSIPAAEPIAEEEMVISPGASYLVTGGLGGFGLATAQWLSDQGATDIILAGRSGASTPEAQEAVASIEQSGVNVTVRQIDVSVAEDVNALISDISQNMSPLKGVFHAAGTLDDGALVTLDRGQFERVMAPKSVGAWNLHLATLDLKLDHFVLYSSVSALVGNVGQGNYAAANAILDGLAQHRRGLGLPAISVNWGALKEVGMAARDPAILGFLERIGVIGFTPSEALEGLGKVMRIRANQAGIVDLDWTRMAEIQSSISRSPRFSHLISVAGSSVTDDRVAQLLIILSRLSEPERLAILQNLLAKQVARVLRIPQAKLDIHQSLMDMGMDSLTGFELLTVIRTVLGVEISPMELMRGVSIVQMARSLHDKLVLEELDGASSDSTPQSPDEVEAFLESMMPASVNG